MKSFVAFTKKEFLESLRTYKLIIMAAVFAALGMMGPLIARFTPEILSAAGMDGMISLPPPTAMDSWAQFYGNVGQMGMLCLVIVFAGLMAGELSKSTLTITLTKGLRRRTVVLSKFTAATAIWSLCFVLCLVVHWAYTVYFFDVHTLRHAFLSFLGLWLFGEFLIALVILGGTLFAGFMGSLLFTGGVTVVMLLLGIFPSLETWNPNSLSSGNIAMLAGARTPGDFLPAYILCAVLTLAAAAASVLVFNKRTV